MPVKFHTDTIKIMCASVLRQPKENTQCACKSNFL